MTRRVSGPTARLAPTRIGGRFSKTPTLSVHVSKLRIQERPACSSLHIRHVGVRSRGRWRAVSGARLRRLWLKEQQGQRHSTPHRPQQQARALIVTARDASAAACRPQVEAGPSTWSNCEGSPSSHLQPSSASQFNRGGAPAAKATWNLASSSAGSLKIQVWIATKTSVPNPGTMSAERLSARMEDPKHASQWQCSILH